MCTRIKTLALLGLIALVPWLTAGCGTAGTSSAGGGVSGGGGSGVGVSGSVEAPTTAATSVSLGASVSKGLGQGNANKVIVSKAVVDQPVSGGEVTITSTAGKVLDKCSVSSSGALQGCDCDPSGLEADKQIIVKVDTSGGSVDLATMVDLSGKSAGDSAAAGTINVDKTLAVNQAISQCGSSATLDNIAACASASGVKLDALFKTFSGTSGSSASVSDTAGVQEAYKKMWRAAMAGGTPPSPAEMMSMINGDTGVIGKFKAFDATVAAFDASAMADVMKNFPVACKGYFNDSTLYSNYKAGGDAAFSQGAANYFKNLKKDDLISMKAKPEVYHNLMGKYAADFAAGTATAFDNFKQPDFAQTMARLASTIDATDLTAVAGKIAATQKLLNGASWGSATFDPAKIAESFGNMIKAADKASEFSGWSTDAASFGTKAYSGAYAGTGGTTSADHLFVTYVQNPTAITGTNAKGCTSATSATDCPTGFTCNTLGGFCVSSTQDASNRPYGSPCTTGGQCASGFCSSGGFCSHDTSVATIDPLAILKAIGASCTAGGECSSGNCSGGSCVAPVVTNAASHHGLYKKTSGQNPSCNINFQIDAPPNATAFFNVQPVNINSPTDNTFFGGGITLTGSSSPFSIAQSNMGGPTTKTGTIKCDGSGDSTTLSLSGSRLTGTCVLTTTSGSPAYPATCTIDHTKL